MSQKRPSFFIQYLLKPIGFGLIIGILVLIILPLLAPQPYKNTPESESQGLISYADAVDLAASAVVNIYTTHSSRQSRYQQAPDARLRLGSGVIMDSKGYILTARHVVEDVDHIWVALQDGRVYGAQLIGSDRLTDLAVLRIEVTNVTVIPINANYLPRVGDVVLAIGNPHNLGQTVTQGIISATGRTDPDNGYSEFIRTDAAINEGNSGGALVNTRGELVGINSGRYLSQQGEALTGVSFSVAYHQALRIMEQIIATGSVTRGYLGVTARQGFYQGMDRPGIIIENIDPQSPAATAGLQVGDFVYQIDQQPIDSLSQALDIVAATAPGKTLTFLFIRQQQHDQTQVVIEQLE